jgi:predicted nucleic acid-binding protein
MKILLDTNIIIHREANFPIHKEIGHMFRWIDNLGYTKYIHNVTIDEIEKHKDKNTLSAMKIKIGNYNQLPTTASLHPSVEEISKQFDIDINDCNDSILLNELLCCRVDILISEDRKIHAKAKILSIEDRVFTIDAFLEKITSENPTLVKYPVPTVRTEYFGNIDLNNEFFDTLREDYSNFDTWFNKKSDKLVYISESDSKLIAFLYLKVEGEQEPYYDISPSFLQKKRLKIGTFKVSLNGYRLGERFLKIVFDNALKFAVQEIYTTIPSKREEHERLIYLLEDFGFIKYGIKKTIFGDEFVYTRDFSRYSSLELPKHTYPFMSKRANKFIVSIYPDYHTDLFPDSILRTESPNDFIENEPHRNAISKVFISRSYKKDLKSGDIIVFYRTSEERAYYQSVITTLGIVESVVTNIKDEKHFIDVCRKRSVFSDSDLIDQWNHNPKYRPFVVKFLYAYSFPKRINLQRLIELEIIKNTKSVPRGFDRLSDESFNKILRETKSDENIVVD